MHVTKNLMHLFVKKVIWGFYCRKGFQALFIFLLKMFHLLSFEIPLFNLESFQKQGLFTSAILRDVCSPYHGVCLVYSNIQSSLVKWSNCSTNGFNIATSYVHKPLSSSHFIWSLTKQTLVWFPAPLTYKVLILAWKLSEAKLLGKTLVRKII